jgi:hypothetical protein
VVRAHPVPQPKRGTFFSIVDLQGRDRYIAERNQDPKRFTWRSQAMGPRVTAILGASANSGVDAPRLRCSKR